MIASRTAIGSMPAASSLETNTRLPRDFDIFSPSSLTSPACAYRRAKGACAARRRRRSHQCRSYPCRSPMPLSRRRPGDPRVRGAHLVMREDQVPAAGLNVERACPGSASRSLRTPRASRACRDRTPTSRTARRAAQPARPPDRSGPSCPAGTDLRRSPRTAGSWSRRPARTPSRTPDRRSGRSTRLRRPRTASRDRPASC